MVEDAEKWEDEDSGRMVEDEGEGEDEEEGTVRGWMRTRTGLIMKGKGW